MTDPVKEQLSACLDGELPAGELDLLLKQVSRDSQLRSSLGRYSLIGETLRAQGAVAPARFAERVSAAIAAEPPLASASVPKRIEQGSARWLRPAAGVAVAAGVAAVAILALQQPSQPQDARFASEPTSAPVARDDIRDPGSYIVPANTATIGIVPAARLTNYVVAHSEYSMPLGRRSVLSGVLAEEDSSDLVEGDFVEEGVDASIDSESTIAAPQR